MSDNLVLRVDAHGVATEELLQKVRLLAPHVDVVEVNAVGIGRVVADRLGDLDGKLKVTL